MFDSSSVKAAELLSYFGKNTAIRIDHRYGQDEVAIVSARTGNTIATIPGITVLSSAELMEEARIITEMRKFPKNRKMNKAWSPIRFSAASKAMMEYDAGIYFA